MKRIFMGAIIAALLAAVLVRYVFWNRLVPLVGMSVNYVRTLNAPPGTLAVERASPSGTATAATAASDAGDWPMYNRTLTSERYSPLAQIDRGNVKSLRRLCTYDTKAHSSFQPGLIMVDDALIGTTEEDIFSIDPNTCAENWRAHEVLKRITVNRGAAYSNGLLFRGSGEGRVLAYDFKTGKRVWATTIAAPANGESVTASPIAWNGLVFIGNAGGDQKGAKGRMYALDDKTGKIVWEFFLVPKGPGDIARGPEGSSPLDLSSWGNQPGIPISGGATWTSYTLDPVTAELYVPAGNSAPDFAPGAHPGANLFSGSVVVLDARTGAYKRHFSLTSGDWHDWDVSNTPAYIHTRGGTRLLAAAPKDGFLYGINLDTSAVVYRRPNTTIDNADAEFSTTKNVHFCPGARGGAEWNSPAFDPTTNLVLVGEVDWCGSVKMQTNPQLQAVKPGAAWAGMSTRNPYYTYGEHDPFAQWAGWLYASDADTGAWVWRAKSNYPIQGAITPTAGGLVFFGDMGGNFYALDSATGAILWSRNLGGALGGGVITYSTQGAQKVAVAYGFTSILWPTKVVTGKIDVYGLP